MVKIDFAGLVKFETKEGGKEKAMSIMHVGIRQKSKQKYLESKTSLSSPHFLQF